MYVMPDSTVFGMTPEPTQFDFSHSLVEFRNAKSANTARL
jgi:hypothetical protein